jgi:hypothetical protein
MYDKINWGFLEEIMASRGFGAKWRSWVMSLVTNGSIAIRLNDRNNAFFKIGKELRQGDPLSPLLFNLVADVITMMLAKVVRSGYIKGLMNSLYPKGVINL